MCDKERRMYMTKRILSILLAVVLILPCFGVCFAAESAETECSAISFTYGDGSAVKEIKAEQMTAKVTVSNGTADAIRPTLVVMSYIGGKMNEIWYESAETSIAAGKSADVAVKFVPNAATGTVIKAVVVDSMKTLKALSKVATAASNSTKLAGIKADGKALEGYSDDTDIYKYKTTSAIKSISAELVDGGQSAEVELAEAFPGISTVKVTASDGSVRTIQIVAYSDDTQIGELIPTVTYGSTASWSGTGVTDESGNYVLTGAAGGSNDRHMRFVTATPTGYVIGGDKILQMEIEFTAVKYASDTKNNGKTLLDIRTGSPETIYNGTYTTTKFEEGKTYTLRMVFDKERNIHVFLGDEKLNIALNKNEDTTANIILAQSSPADATASNVLSFKKPVCTVYPSSYDIITPTGEVGKTEEMFKIEPTMEITTGEAADYRIDVTPTSLTSGGYSGAKAAVVYETTAGVQKQTEAQTFDLSSMKQGNAYTLSMHIADNTTVTFMGKTQTYTIPSGSQITGITFSGYKGSDSYKLSNEKYIKIENVMRYDFADVVPVGKNLSVTNAKLNVAKYTQDSDYNSITLSLIGKNSSGAEVSAADVNIPMDAANDGDIYTLKYEIAVGGAINVYVNDTKTSLSIPDSIKSINAIAVYGLKSDNEYNISDYSAKVYDSKILGFGTPSFNGRDANTLYITDTGTYNSGAALTSTNGEYTLKKNIEGGVENTLKMTATAIPESAGFVRYEINVKPYGELTIFNAKPNMLGVRINTLDVKIREAYKLDMLVNLTTHEVRYYKNGVMTTKSVPGEGSETTSGQEFKNYEFWVRSEATTCPMSNIVTLSNVKQTNYSSEADFTFIESEIANAFNS